MEISLERPGGWNVDGISLKPGLLVTIVLHMIIKNTCRSEENQIYYPPEVRRGKYWGSGVFLLQYFPLVKI